MRKVSTMLFAILGILFLSHCTQADTIDDTLAMAQKEGKVVMLELGSVGCSPCEQMKPVMHSFEQAGYPIREVDTTRESQMSQQYNVNQIPCFVMLVNGREVERQIGATSTESLEQMFDRAKQAVSQSKEVMDRMKRLFGE